MSSPDENQDGVLWYPGVYHVRAADDLVISFDFERNGWVIKMEPSVLDEHGELEATPIDEQEPPEEVAFVPAFLIKEEK